MAAQNRMNLLKLLTITGTALLVTTIPLISLAEATDGLVEVRIREIHGIGMVEKDGEAAAVSENLYDLNKKLKKLNYKHYKLLGTRKQQVALKKKTDINLADGHILTVRPLYLTPGEKSSRIGMWLHWADKSGMEILDTRMHFTCGEAMVTGMEQTSKDGRILAIDVTPLN